MWKVDDYRIVQNNKFLGYRMWNVCETKYSKYKYRKKVTTIRPTFKVIITVKCTFTIRSSIQNRHDSARNLHLRGKKFVNQTRTAHLTNKLQITT